MTVGNTGNHDYSDAFATSFESRIKNKSIDAENVDDFVDTVKNAASILMSRLAEGEERLNRSDVTRLSGLKAQLSARKVKMSAMSKFFNPKKYNKQQEVNQKLQRAIEVLDLLQKTVQGPSALKSRRSGNSETKKVKFQKESDLRLVDKKGNESVDMKVKTVFTDRVQSRGNNIFLRSPEDVSEASSDYSEDERNKGTIEEFVEYSITNFIMVASGCDTVEDAAYEFNLSTEDLLQMVDGVLESLKDESESREYILLDRGLPIDKIFQNQKFKGILNHMMGEDPEKRDPKFFKETFKNSLEEQLQRESVPFISLSMMELFDTTTKEAFLIWTTAELVVLSDKILFQMEDGTELSKDELAESFSKIDMSMIYDRMKEWSTEKGGTDKEILKKVVGELLQKFDPKFHEILKPKLESWVESADFKSFGGGLRGQMIFLSRTDFMESFDRELNNCFNTFLVSKYGKEITPFELAKWQVRFEKIPPSESIYEKVHDFLAAGETDIEGKLKNFMLDKFDPKYSKMLEPYFEAMMNNFR